MIKNLHIYKSGSYDPYFNLAVEEYLFETLPKDSIILYLWQNKNTVVIGTNQNPWNECNIDAMEKDGILLARRKTGGGAVFHDIGNLNFTFICEKENYNLKKQMSVIQKACSYCNISADISGRNDITAEGKKFSGNAFLSSKGKNIHHGTILISADKEKMTRYLSPSEMKLQAKGVKSVKSRVINLSELCKELDTKSMSEYMQKAFDEIYGMESSYINPSFENLKTEYSDWDYLYGKTMPFTCKVNNRFEWGEIEILLNIEKAVIKDVQVYTDSMYPSLADEIKSALKGIKYQKSHIETALENTEFSKDIISILS